MAKKGFPGGMPGMGGMNMNKMLKQAQKMQEDMAKAQKELEEKEVVSISIKEEVVDPDDVEMLEDLVLSAVNEALRNIDDLQANQMNKLTGGMNIPGLF